MKTKEEWLDDMELRLKRAFLDVADLSEDEGRRFLSQEIRSHLDDVSGESTRRDYLLSLRERFPLLLSQESRLTAETIRDMRNATADVTPEQALAVARRRWEEISPESREAFLHAFAPESETGGGSGGLEEASDELSRFLKISSDSPLSAERLQEVLLALLKTVSQVDALGTQVYKQMELSREVTQGDLRKIVGDYITGEAAGAEQMNRLLDETRLKIGLIISSIASLPNSLSQTHLAKFQPALIEQAAGAGGGLLSGKEAKYWKKYVTLAEDLQPQKVEKAINDLMVTQLRKLKRS